MLLVLMVGCTSSQGSISKGDMSIVKINNHKQIVQYGMNRADTEKVLGKGEKGLFGIKYDDGVIIQYRDEKVAGIV